MPSPGPRPYRHQDSAALLAALRRQLDSAPIGSLREVRIARSLSIRELAGASGIWPSTIVRAESGGRPHPRTRRAIAEALGLPASAIDWDAPAPATTGDHPA